MSDKWDILSLDEIRTAREVMVTIVDVDYFRNTHPEIFEVLCQRARQSPDTFISCVTYSEIAHQFWYAVGIPAEAQRVRINSMVDAWPHLLVLEPNNTAPDVFSLVGQGYQKFSGVRRDAYLRVASELATTPIKKLMAPLYKDYSQRLKIA